MGGSGRSGGGSGGGSADDAISLLGADAPDDSVGIDMLDIGIELTEEPIGGSDMSEASGIACDGGGAGEDWQPGPAQDWAKAGEARAMSPSARRDR